MYVKLRMFMCDWHPVYVNPQIDIYWQMRRDQSVKLQGNGTSLV